ncbi:hypothetical protein [Nostoc sp. 106C]|uniref:hypothetical protein n=1 Tax=Nostoc sp. 106C TaxID=1932667 RepID=UPI0014132423|nr:hypothetical protein [Nostoc sp. 106C]
MSGSPTYASVSFFPGIGISKGNIIDINLMKVKSRKNVAFALTNFLLVMMLAKELC